MKIVKKCPNGNLLMYAIKTALGKPYGFFMSFCIVGKAEVPPKANSIVPNAKENDKNVGGSLIAVSFSGKSVIMSANTSTTAKDVATVAPIAAGLQVPKPC